MAAIPQTLIAVLGDLVGSRELSDSDRLTAQARLRDLMTRLDAVAGDSLASRFVITAGDEFQGLVSSGSVLPSLLFEVQTFDGPCAIRLGFGRGALVTELHRDAAIGMDGPVFHRAREAIEASESESRDAPRFRGFSDLADVVLDGLGRALHDRRMDWTDRQREITVQLRRGAARKEVAAALSISPQAVAKHVARAGLDGERVIEHAMLETLIELDAS